MDGWGTLGESLVTDHLREQFKNDISPRRLAHTCSLLDLCRVLRAQCQLNREHLEIIKSTLPAATSLLLDQVYAQWQTETCDGKSNVYARIRESPVVTPRSEEPTIRPQHHQPLPDEQRRQNAYRLIAEEIGKKWRELGRELNVAEGHLDAIDNRHRESMSDKVYAVLAKFEERIRPRDQNRVLLGALEKVRRKDLVREVQDLLLE